MLYERWREIAREYRKEIALRDLTSNQEWTFSELAAATERRSKTPPPIVHPQGVSASFVLTVLEAWRFGQILCPLETGQTQPSFAQLPPAACVHLKLTSATTGASRMVAFTAAQLAADAANIVATMNLRRDWWNLGVISLAHSYGFSNLVLPLLLHG